MEALENRELLSVSATDWSSVAAYAEFGLASTMSAFTSADGTVHEISAADLSVSSLKSAIDSCESTTGDDVIVVRTTSAKNTITFAAASDTMDIDFRAVSDGTLGAVYGSVTIVAVGDTPLTINANGKGNVFNLKGRSVVNMANMTIVGGSNTATGGGGIYISNAKTVNLSNMTFAGNSAAGSGGSRGEGGAVYAAYCDYLQFNQVIFADNQATNNGGAFFSESYSKTTFTDVDFIRNTAQRGGAVYTYNSTLNIEGSAIPQTVPRATLPRR